MGDFVCQAALQKLDRQKSQNKYDEKIRVSGPTMNSSEKGVSFLETWDRDRSLRQGCIGGLLLGPSLHFFFTRIVPRVTYPARSAGFNVFMRVAAQ